MKIDIINDEIYIRGLKAFNLKSMLECDKHSVGIRTIPKNISGLSKKW